MAKKNESVWAKAIEEVLNNEGKPLHYSEIATKALELDWFESAGATPANSVSTVISLDFKKKREKSKYLKIEPGVYTLKSIIENKKVEKDDTNIQKLQLIQSMGIYWDRNKVGWDSSKPNIYGRQGGKKATIVDFKDQVGIYLLHDSRETIYIGQALDSIGKRLHEHTTDRLSGRWDRFSWFGFYPIKDSIVDIRKDNKYEIGIKEFADLLEAILIESVEPRLNKKGGNNFSGIEYNQVIILG